MKAVTVAGALAALGLALAAGAAAAQSAADGAGIVNSRCNICHADPNSAPSLAGVSGRQIASSAYSGYSDALKAHAKDSWSDANLDAFLTDSQAFASGSWMDFKEPDAKARASVIAYLKTLK
jgi:cytochrome c